MEKALPPRSLKRLWIVEVICYDIVGALGDAETARQVGIMELKQRQGNKFTCASD